MLVASGHAAIRDILRLAATTGSQACRTEVPIVYMHLHAFKSNMGPEVIRDAIRSPLLKRKERSISSLVIDRSAWLDELRYLP